MRMNFSLFKKKQNKFIEFPCRTEGHFWKYHIVLIKIKTRRLHISQTRLSPLKRLHKTSFFGVIMDSSETSTHTTSTSGSSYSTAAPLRNVQFDPSNAGMIEEQQQKIKHLQEQLAEFNHVRYRTLPANASGCKNVVRTSKRKSLTATDCSTQPRGM